MNYICRIATSDMVDRSAFKDQDKSVYIPYRTKEYLYGEYSFYCDFNGVVERASLTTFRRAYAEAERVLLSKHDIVLKLSGGKGKFFIICIRWLYRF